MMIHLVKQKKPHFNVSDHLNTNHLILLCLCPPEMSYVSCEDGKMDRAIEHIRLIKESSVGVLDFSVGSEVNAWIARVLPMGARSGDY
ncbi:hypothetical protein TcWFU_000069 [Taenia crassiceps]|uniref:Uncharacterized protein n=1 Tax=Taenia crassiceps TaxID=6207 RepID=A0ABR4Q620_9CEST